jgi:flagellar biosynthesis chaperone FliJ
MKKFKFSLEAALGLRSFTKKQAGMSLALAAAQRRKTLARLESMQEQLREAEAQSTPARGESIRVDALLRRQATVSYCREQVALAKKADTDAVEEEARCYRSFMDARLEEETLLRLKEKSKEQHRVDVIRAQELAVEEFINARKRSALL